MTKSNRDAAGTMGGNVLDEQAKGKAVAKLSDNAGPTPAVIESRTYAAGDYPDPETSRRAENGPALSVAFPLTMETVVRVGQRHERFTTHDRDTMRAVAAVAHPSAQVQYVATNDAPWRRGIEVTVKAFLPYDLDGDTLRDIDAVNEGDNLIAQAARRLTGKRGATEVIEAIGRHHVRGMHDIARALGVEDGESMSPEMRKALAEGFGFVDPSSRASRPYQPSRDDRWNDPTCAAMVAYEFTEAQACEWLAKRLNEARADIARLRERHVEPMAFTMPATREGFATPRDATKPAGRWTAHHPDPATKARIEADLNAKGSAVLPAGAGVEFVEVATSPEPCWLRLMGIGDNDGMLVTASAVSDLIANFEGSPPLPVTERYDGERVIGWIKDLDLDCSEVWARVEWCASPGRPTCAWGLSATVMADVRHPLTGERKGWRLLGAVPRVAEPNYATREEIAALTIPDLTNAPRTTTITASPTELRALADAIGQAIETGTGVAPSFNGGKVTVTRDELRFSGALVIAADGIAITADTRALHRLRKAVIEARETGRGTATEWGKGTSVEVLRRGELRKGDAPTVAAQATTEPVRYDGEQGGAQAWRWEVEG